MNNKNIHQYLSYLEAIKQLGREANPFFVLMGINIIHIGEGEATLEMEVRPDMYNGQGWLPGGIFVSLTDEAMAIALYTVLEDGEHLATITQNTHFIKGVQVGKLIASGKVLRKGRRIAFTEGEVHLETGDGELMVKTTATFAVISR